jgi:hypothetical protein
LVNTAPLPIAATIALEMIGPMPGPRQARLDPVEGQPPDFYPARCRLLVPAALPERSEGAAG